MSRILIFYIVWNVFKSYYIKKLLLLFVSKFIKRIKINVPKPYNIGKSTIPRVLLIIFVKYFRPKFEEKLSMKYK